MSTVSLCVQESEDAYAEFGFTISTPINLIFPLEIMEIISYYICNQNDLVNCLNSGVFPMLHDRDYPTRRMNSYENKYMRMMFKELMSRERKLLDKLEYFQYDNLNILNLYKQIFHNGGLNYKSDKLVRVMYQSMTTFHKIRGERYSLDDEIDNFLDLNEYSVVYSLPYGISKLPIEFYEQNKLTCYECNKIHCNKGTEFQVIKIEYI